MKTVFIIIDGVSDDPIKELDFKTPLEAALAPNIHSIANKGKVGRIKTTFPGFPIESMVCIMGLIGYDPKLYYPNGRAGFEAMAKKIPLNDGDLILRCNIVALDEQGETISDFTSGLISDENANEILSKIKLPKPEWELYPGQSYRNILIIRQANINLKNLICFEPHMHMGEPLAKILPVGKGASSNKIAIQLQQYILGSREQIKRMNLKNVSAGMLWVWSPSKKPTWPSFETLSGHTAAFVGGLDFFHGIAMAAGIHFDTVPGATGYIDTNYAGKANYTIKHLQKYNFVITHINAADEEAHVHNFKGKIKAIEHIDREIVGPVLRYLQAKHANNFRIVVCGDHKTRCSDGRHVADPVPFAIYGKKIPASGVRGLYESICLPISPIPSLNFLKEVVFK